MIACSFVFSQKNYDPIFASFKGTAYELPRKKYNFKYHPKYEKQKPIGTLEWEKIDIPETPDKEVIPEIGKKYGYCIIFKSEMKIEKEGWYKFALNSDDGSILWIDKKAVVLNDGTHQMRFKEDSIALRPGNYPIKIWYYQGFPDRYGIQFSGKYYRDFLANETAANLASSVAKPMKMIIPNQILNFDHNQYRLDATAKIFMDSIANKILTYQNISKIKITGHTDNVGKNDFNLDLSMRRANTIRIELEKRISNQNIKYEVEGLGESQPIEDNSTAAGRAKNRRVEIEIKTY
ncbi:MAG: OmpA family protein [Bacteroidota bacterium]